MKWIFNLLCFAVLQLFLVSLQTSLWMQVLGDFPAPQFWLPALVYWSLYRKPYESVAMVYLTTILAGSLTVLPYSLLLLTLILIYLSLFFLKERIYWSGSTFYMLACGFSTLLFPIAHLVISWVLEPNPIHDPEPFHWIISVLMTMLISLPLYRVFTLIDRLIKRSEGPETREGLL